MADLDSLSIILRASSKDAVDAVDAIQDALKRLNGALENFSYSSKYMRGLETLSAGLKSIRISLNGLDAKNIVAVSKALDKLCVAAEKLSGLTNFAPTIDTKSMTKVVAASQKAIGEAERIGKEFKFEGNEQVNELAEAIERLYASVGNDDAVRDAMKEIDDLVLAYGRYENELHDIAKTQNEVIKSSHIKLPKDWVDVLGGDYETARKNRAQMGIRNTSKEGGSTADIVNENEILGLQELSNEGENAAQVLERLKKNTYDATHELVGFSEASETITGGMEGVQSVANELVNSLGLVAEKIREVKSTTAGGDLLGAADDDDFVDIFSDPAEAVERLRNSAQQAAPAVEQLNTAEENVVTHAPQLQQIENIFSGISVALQSLQGVTLSDSLKNIEHISGALGKFGGQYAAPAAENIKNVAEAIKGFDVQIPNMGEELTAFANGLAQLGKKKVTDGFTNLINLKVGLEGFNGLKIDPTVTASIQQLGDGLYKFGLAKMDKAVSNIPQLATNLSQLITSLSNLPAVGESTIRLVEAMGNMNVSAGTLGRSMGSIGTGMKRYTGHAISARKASMSLAQAFGKMYANFFIFFRLARRFKSDIDLASQLTEVQNVVDVAFTDMAEKMNDFSKSAIDNLGMAELTAKQIGSKYQAMGSAMGISDTMVKKTNDFVQSATDGYADIADSMADVSINITRLAGDMASFYNQDYADVAEKLQAIFTGQTRPLRAFGLDLTQATLQEWALRNGIEANIKTMTQAEKTLLRYQYVMAQTTAAQGDFIRTQNTWANQTRIATEKLNQLRIILGKIAIYTFKPLVQNFNKAMDQILKGAEGLLNALGKIFGWQVEWTDAGVLDESTDDAEELADNMGDAADNAKKFKNFLLGIDEINLLPDNSDKDKGGAGGLDDLIGDMGELGKFNIKPIEKGFDSLYDTLFKLGKRINEVIGEILDAIDWEKVYKKARRFGGGLADFLNGLLSNSETFNKIGRFFANSINTIAHSLDEFHKRFDGFQLGVDLGSLINGFIGNLDWNVIKSAAVGKAHDLAQTINGAFLTIDWKLLGTTIAEGLNTAIDYFYTLGKEIKWTVIGTSIADGINGFFRTFDFMKAADTLNYWAKGLLDALIAALDRTDWKQVGRQLGNFIARIDVISVGAKVGRVLWEVVNAAFSTMVGMFESAPLETAIGTALIIPFSNKYFRKNIAGNIANFSRLVGTSLSKDLSKVFNGSVFKNFGSAFNATVFGSAEGGMFDGWLNTNTLQGVANGFNAINKSLTTTTKAVGSIGVGLGEFFTVKDAVFDLVHGTDNLGASILELVGAAGAASVALSALLGVPAGLIVAGATAGVAAILGIADAFDKLAEENVMSTLSKEMGDSYYTLEEVTQGFASLTDEVTKEINNMDKEFDKVENLKDDLAEMIGKFGLIGEAANTGNTLTSDSLSALIGNLEDVKKAWEDYINAQYDYLLQSTVNNMNFIKSQRDLTEEESKYFTDRINQLEEAKRTEVQASSEAMQELNAAWDKYSAIKDKSVPTEVLRQAKKDVEDATAAVYGLAQSSGVLDEFSQSVSKSAISLSDGISKITFEDLDTRDYESFLASVEGYNTSFVEKYSNTVETIEDYKNQLISTGKYTAAEAEMETAEYFNTIDTAAKNALDSVQLSLYDKLYSFVGKNDYAGATDFYNNVMIPYTNMIKDQYGKATDGLKPWVAEKGGELITESFEYAYDYRDEGVGMGVRSKLKKGWQEIFWQLRDDVAPDARKAGKETVGKFGKGVEDGSKGISSVMKETSHDIEKSGETSAAGLNNANRAMQDMRNVSVLAFNGMTDLTKVMKETGESGNGIKDISTNVSGIGTALGTVNTALAPVKTGFLEFTTQAQTNMMNMSQIFNQAFGSITKYGNQTISWMKSSFIPYFSGSYWNSITASIPNAFGNAFRQAINIMVNLWKQFAQWANDNMKINAQVAKNGNGAKAEVKIPQYSTGGFPEDGLFQANHGELVGKFANGQTAVANNEQIVEGIRQGVYEAVSAAMAGGQGITVELVGDTANLFTAVVKENNRAIMRTGNSPLRR